MRVTKAINRDGGAIRYDAVQQFDFPVATLGTTQANTFGSLTTTPFIPLLFNIKIIGVTIAFGVVNGAAAMSFNICLGTAAENGIGPVDNTGVGGIPPTVAAAGNCLFAADQQINGAAVPVANTVYSFASNLNNSNADDIIWPQGGLLTARFVTGAAASGSTPYLVVWGKPVNIHPNLPDTFHPYTGQLASL